MRNEKSKWDINLMHITESKLLTTGTDVRRLNKGVGRKANVEPRWRRNLYE